MGFLFGLKHKEQTLKILYNNGKGKFMSVKTVVMYILIYHG
jgi:hypothetical protein